MSWKQSARHGEECWVIGNYSLVKWGVKRFWALYRSEDDWREETRLVELPYETSSDVAKEKSIEFLMEKLDNKELKELAKG